MEIWKDVPGYEGRYKVSSAGRVVGKRSGLKNEAWFMLASNKHEFGYLRYCLFLGSTPKIFYAHQLVAMAFLNHKRNGYNSVVDHIDSNPSNNCVENLRVISQRDNATRGMKNKTGYTGVAKKGKKYVASAQIHGKATSIGSFNTAKDAGKAYLRTIKSISK